MLSNNSIIPRKRRFFPSVGRLSQIFDIAPLIKDYEENIAHLDWDHCHCAHSTGLESVEKGSYEQINLTSPTGNYQLGHSVVKGSWEWFSEQSQVNQGAGLKEFKKFVRQEPEVLDSVRNELNFKCPTPLLTSPWMKVLSEFKAEVTRVRLSRLGPYSQLHSHIDYDTTFSVRLHIPLITNKDSFICVKRAGKEFEEFHLPADGLCYFVNQGYEHFAVNRGETPRIHLVISLRGQDDVLDLISESVSK